VQVPGSFNSGYELKPFASWTVRNVPVTSYVPLMLCPTGRYVPEPESKVT
jgi:hypothetical protein